MSRRYQFPGATSSDYALGVEPVPSSLLDDNHETLGACFEFPASSSCLELALLISLHLYSNQEVVSIHRLVSNGVATPATVLGQVRGQLKSCYRLDRILRELEYITQDDRENKDDRDDPFGLSLTAAIWYSDDDGKADPQSSPSDQIDFCLGVCRYHHGVEAEAEWRLSLLYRRSFMSHREATRIARTLASIIDQVYACRATSNGIPSPTLQEVACIAFDTCDRSTVLQWNSERALQSQGILIHDLFSSIAVKYPDSEAVVALHGRMTYAVLNEVSTVVASHLRTQITAEDQWLALYFTKSCGVWAVVAMLAALKSGRGCTFLDSSWPDERLCAVLRATKARYVLTHGAQSLQRLEALSELAQCQIVNVSDIATAATTQDVEELHYSSVRPDDSAFAVFTSGSTGTPKGIVLTHRNVCTAIIGLIMALAADAARVPTAQRLRVLQFASYAFDASLSDMLVALLSGGTICIASDTERTGDLQEYIQNQMINLAFLTPTVARTLDPASLCRTLQTLVLIGEPVTTLDKEQWSNSGIAVFNGYGPTESTFGASLGRIEGSKSPHNIGYSLGYRFWVISCSKDDKSDPSHIDARHLLPIGATGELVLEGPALAQGYLNDTKLTQMTFKTGPAWLPTMNNQASQERRVYLTGDLVRYHEDGSLECLGRIENDTQVKLGGQRLELTEIERLLVQAAASTMIHLHDVAVCLPRNGGVADRLVALIVLNTTICSGSEEFILLPCDAATKTMFVDHLSSRVPAWMVPSIWVQVNHIPTTSSGKRDSRRLLLALQLLRPEQYLGDLSHTRSVPSCNNVSRNEPPCIEALIRISSEVLQLPVERVFESRSFVQLGGDSITALQVSARMRKECSVPLSPQDLLRYPTLREAALEAKSLDTPAPVEDSFAETSLLRKQVLSSTPDLHAMTEDMFPCSLVQESFLYGAQGHPVVHMVSATWSVTETGQESGNPQPLDPQVFAQAWKRVIQKNAALRTVPMELPDMPGVFVNIVLKDSGSSIELIQSSETYDTNLVEEAHLISMKCEAGQQYVPPLKLTYSSGTNEPTLVRLDASHALLDGLSVMALLRQLSAEYHAVQAGSPRLSASMQTSSQHPMRSYVGVVREKQRCESALEYWKQYLSDAQPCLFPELIDRERNSTDSDHLESHRLQSVPLQDISAVDLSSVLATHGLTTATFFTAIWSMVLQMYVKASDVIFGYVSSGRDIPNCPVSTDDIGCFIVPLVARVNLQNLNNIDREGLISILHCVQQSNCASAPHQGLSLAQIQTAMPHSAGGLLFNTFVSVTPSLGLDSSSLHFEQLHTSYDSGVS